MSNSLIRGAKAPRSSFDSDKALPLTPEEISAEWLSEALGVAVTDFKLASVIHGTSSKVFLDLTFADDVQTDTPTRLCVKGGFNPVVRDMFPEMWGTYRREAEFYYYIAPLTNMLLPKTWFCGTDAVNGQGLFIMSDVASECSFGNPLQPWTPERVAEGLAQLASLHGKTWNSKEDEYPWLFSKDGEKLANPMRTVILALLRPEPWAVRFAEECRPPVAEPMQDRERMVCAYEALWKHSDEEKRFQSIIHGDNHVGNTLITNEGTPGFIDWQCLQYGSPIHDLVYFLTGALTIEDRRQHEIPLVEGYLEALHAEGGPKLTKDDVWDDYRRHTLHGFLWAATPLKMQPDDIVFAITERYSAAIMDHKTLELLEGKE
ncbi:kinase-like domain-containing protein [Ilyonectria destructans]|nr:kinase-like domain-containing protein [Ilyonectria destructans]